MGLCRLCGIKFIKLNNSAATAGGERRGQTRRTHSVSVHVRAIVCRGDKNINILQFNESITGVKLAVKVLVLILYSRVKMYRF